MDEQENTLSDMISTVIGSAGCSSLTNNQTQACQFIALYSKMS